MTDKSDKTIVKPLKSQPTPHSPDDATIVRPSPGVDATVLSGLSGQPQAGRVHGNREQLGIGSIINNRFVIEELLGAGGMGVVYRVLDRRKQEAQDKDLHVALKILGKDFQSHPQAFVALQREARKSQNLAHPNIITVYDFDRDGDMVYMTMEELHGKTLEETIRNNPQGLDTDTALHIIRSIAAGLAYAHSKEIVHSDLKPGNIFLTDKGEVKILDFGIARAITNAADENDQTVFDATELGGLTPSYASCEMLAGKEPQPSDDIYALGLMSYELLSGLHPYQRKPATLAVSENLAAPRLKKIRHRQARTLMSSVALRRDDRLQTASEFQKGIDPPRSQLAIGALSAALLLTVTIIVLFQLGILGGERDLPEELQQRIAEHVEAGNDALVSSDYDAALNFYVQAYDVYPENPEALVGFDTLVVALLNSDLENLDNTVRQERLPLVNRLLQYPYLADDANLIELRAKLQEQLSFTSK